LYFTVAVAYAASHQIVGSLPFLVLFQVGFLYTGVLSLRESGLFAARRTPSRPSKEAAPVTGSWMPSAGS
ncbi:MAG TPA: hypothetical protein VEK15_30950, partial [Vicinamibacteria bacterium]|nr:hypothetical protein [Vicinamibacteria bacterium]